MPYPQATRNAKASSSDFGGPPRRRHPERLSATIGARLSSGPDLLRGNCSFYGRWRDQLEMHFGHVLGPPRLTDCPHKSPSSNSLLNASHCLRKPCPMPGGLPATPYGNW